VRIRCRSALGPHFCADIDVGSRRHEELPYPGIESVTNRAVEEKGRRPHCMVNMLVGSRFAAMTSSSKYLR
jgi:hypothetical protein